MFGHINQIPTPNDTIVWYTISTSHNENRVGEEWFLEPERYATRAEAYAALLAKGFTPCGICAYPEDVAESDL